MADDPEIVGQLDRDLTARAPTGIEARKVAPNIAKVGWRSTAILQASAVALCFRA